MPGSLLSEALLFVAELFAQTVTDWGVAWLLDKRNRRPWIAIGLVLSIATGFVLLVFFRSQVPGPVAWVMIALFVAFGLYAFLDLVWWREQQRVSTKED